MYPSDKRGYFEYAHAVEPELKNFNLLNKNVNLNNLDERILTYNFALSNSDDSYLEMELSKIIQVIIELDLLIHKLQSTMKIKEM